MGIAVVVRGDGTSLWCDSDKSKREFVVTEMETRNCHGSDEPYELVLYGPDTEWFHYTDDGIEDSVNKQFVRIVQDRYPHHVIKRITWSEHGMQPDKGWSFDIHSAPKCGEE